MPLDLSDNKSVLVKVMAWHHQTMKHYLEPVIYHLVASLGVTVSYAERSEDLVGCDRKHLLCFKSFAAVNLYGIGSDWVQHSFCGNKMMLWTSYFCSWSSWNGQMRCIPPFGRSEISWRCYDRNAFHITGPMWGESTVHWWISLTNGKYVFSLLLAWKPVEITVESLVICDAMKLVWHNHNVITLLTWCLFLQNKRRLICWMNDWKPLEQRKWTRLTRWMDPAHLNI